MSEPEIQWPVSRRVERSLAETIEESHTRLDDLLECLDPDEPYEKLQSTVLEKFNGGSTADDLWEDLMLPYLTRSDPAHHFIPIIISCAYSIQAQQAMDVGHTEKAWFFLTEASYYRGLAEGTAADENALKVAEQNSEDRKKGGLAKAGKIKPARDEAVRLLREMRPAAGWNSKVEAADTIVPHLMAFVKDREIPLTLSNLPKKLREWLSKDAEVSAAFDATKHP